MKDCRGDEGEMKNRKRRIGIAAGTAYALIMLSACGISDEFQMPFFEDGSVSGSAQAESYDTLSDVPEYSGEPYVEINDNQPDFTEEELTTVSYEEYSELDSLGRCGEAEACIGEDLMPTQERESISEVIPSGWENNEYDIVDGGYLYNRCHLIGYQLTGENANEENLITGTRYMNTEGMLPFEDMVAEYVHETEYHVMYRVTPVFEGDDLVASGVHMEAKSVEDDGAGISFNVYVYNVQPDITIDYSTGDNWETPQPDSSSGTEQAGTQESVADDEEQTYILNINSHKFHKPDCPGVKDMKEKNREEYTGVREELIKEGYEPCGKCKP